MSNPVAIDEVVAQIEKSLILDVRSPAEFAQGHIPGAVNLPLFTNEERAVVGTAYKQESREAAIKLGLDFFGPKMRPMVEEVERKMKEMKMKDGGDIHSSITNHSSLIYIYCWRGGMRSGAVAWLLQLYGFQIKRLNGGYKSFRQWALKQFGQTNKINILGGYTGSGKTELLQSLALQHQQVIDLEALAHHKGSAFGSLGLPPQPTQEQFENRLAVALYKTQGQPFWLEDESQRIGRVLIPNGLWEQMRAAPIYFIDLPFNERLQFIMGYYGNFDTTQLSESIERISKRLGPQNTKAALQFLAEGNKTECFRILLQYYDKLYNKGLHSRPNLPQQLQRLPCTTIGAHNVISLSSVTSHEKI